MAKLFDFLTGNNLEGKGVSKEKSKKDVPLSFLNFFKMLFRRFGVVITANLLFIITNFPLIIAFFGYLGYFNGSDTAPFSALFPNLYGIEKLSGMNGAIAALDTLLGTTRTVGVVTDTTRILLYCGFLCVFTFGFANCGLTYLFRSCVRRESVSAWSDFFEAIRKNAKQCFVIGLIDALAAIVIVFDATFFYGMASDMTYTVLYYLMLGVAIVYIMARPYFYILATTFSYKVKQIIGYSIRLSMLGIKRNILSLLLSGVIAYVTLLLFSLNPVVGVFFPLFFTFGIIGFANVYAGYPVAIKYLLKKDEEVRKKKYDSDEVDYDDDDDDPVFRDRG